MINLITFNYKRMIKSKSSIVFFVLAFVMLFFVMFMNKQESSKKINIFINANNEIKYYLASNMDKKKVNKDLDFIIKNSGIVVDILENNKKIDINFKYYNLNSNAEYETFIIQALTNFYYGVYIEKGMKEEIIPDLNIDKEYISVDNNGNINVKNSNYGNKMVQLYSICVISYFLIVFSGSMIVLSIASEKLEKTFDLLVYRIKPINIIFSKVISTVLFIFTFIICSVLEYMILSKVFNTGSISLLFGKSDISYLNLILLFITIIFSFLTQFYIFIFSGLFVKDMNSLNTSQAPAMILAVVIFYFNIYIINSNNNLLEDIISKIPIFSTVIIQKNILLDKLNTLDFVIFLISNFILIFIFNKLIDRYVKTKYN